MRRLGGSQSLNPYPKNAQEVAGAEARRSQLELQAEAAGEERRSLARALEELQLSCAAGQADVAAAQRDLDAVRDKVTLACEL